MPKILTTKGEVDADQLVRTTIFEERPSEFVIAVEYKLDGELVKRDCHVVLKEPSATADAIVGGL